MTDTPHFFQLAAGQWLCDLVPRGQVDTAVIGSHFTFAPLGTEEKYLDRELQLKPGELREAAGLSSTDQAPTLVAVASRRQGAGLKGLVLASDESSRSYDRFATPCFGRPYRDFYYNVIYEALALATSRFEARRVALSHLSAGGRSNSTAAVCAMEAAAHLRAAGCEQLEALVFFGCCLDNVACATRRVLPIASPRALIGQ